jgi:putative transposase
MITSPVATCLRTVLHVGTDVLRLFAVSARSRTRLAAENLFLRGQLALYVERQVKPRRVDNATWITLVIRSRWIDWRRMLTVVQQTR